MYIDKLLPFVKESDFVRNTVETHRIEDIFIPFDKVNSDSVQTKKGRMFNALYIKPCDILVMNESDETSNNILNGVYGDTVSLNVTYLDYSSVASGINIDENEDGSSYTASKRVLNGFDTREITTDLFVSLASNYATATEEFISDIRVVPSSEITFDELVKFGGEVNEDSKYLDSLFNSQKNTNKVALDFEKKTKNTDTTFKWLYSYFDAPESAENSRETVPLLIGPTAVFKSATVKELCKEFNYRLVDFRVSFTSRLDYTGLINMAKIDDELFSYSCPMEEIVTCSDGFREYCDRAYRKIEEILERGYLEDDKVSDGEGVESTQVPINGEQDRKLKVLRDRYKDYARTPVLFFDEITRCRDDGVNNVLVELLNKKKLDNMTLYGCKFVAATNANVMNDSTHMELKDELDELYDVNNKIDVAYANRFHPIIVLPEDVMDRWFEWANSTTERGEDGNKKTVTSIHPIILDFLNRNKGYVYNDRPVLDVVRQGLHLNEQRAQTFPNYRTWDMLSNYLYEIDDLYESRVKANPDIDPSQINKEFKTKIIVGLISKWGADAFIPELEKNGYVEYEDNHGKVDDEVGDFLQSSLEAGVPAMLIGPSSMGKTSRVKAYIKRRKLETGKEPLLLDISLASKDAVDLMGMPKKQTLTEYVSGSDLSSLGLGSVGKELSGIMDEVVSDGSYGMVDSLTLRAPGITYKKAFEKAKAERREVILFFDECNRCTNPAVMASMFECFTGENTVKLLDGRSLTMEELYKEAESGNTDLWTYSVTADGTILPAHISCVIKKNPTTRIVEIEMEDGSIVRCTEDHKFMLKDGSYVMAKDLDETMEIMEVESRDSTESDMPKVSGYEIVSTNAKGSEDFTHRIVAENCKGWFNGCGKVIHHVDFNKKNNNPENLDCSMTYSEHIDYHGKHLESFKSSTDFEDKRLKGLKEFHNDKDRVKKAHAKRLETLKSDPEKWEDRNRKISETRKKKCEESDEYKNGISASLMKYNEKVKTGEIVRDYFYLRGKRPLDGEDLEKFRERAKRMSNLHWGKEESHIKQSERLRLLNQREDFREINRKKTSMQNKDPDMKLKQKIGKIRKVVEEAVKIGDFSKELYESVRLSKYKYGVPTYGKAEEILSKAGISFDLVLQGVM